MSRLRYLPAGWRELFLGVVVVVSAVSFAQEKPNVVILFADDLGWGDLGIYGHPTSSSPNLDKMASEGLRFMQFYSASGVCSPSRAALLTGRYQVRSGIWPMVFGAASLGGLPHNETTIAEALKEVGYSSGIVGKWHLGAGVNFTYLPTTQGFDYYLGIPYSHDMCPCYVCFYPNDSCFDHCRTGDVGCPLFQNDEIVQQPADFTTLTARYTDGATAFIHKNAGSKTPFFLYMAYQHTHHPQFASQMFRNKTLRGTMGDSLAELDWSVGQIFSALKEAGVENNTFVFFTADNGPSLTRQVRGGNQGLLKCGKGTTYEGGQREPGIAWMPGKIPAGQTTLELAGTVDLLPTVLTMAGAKIPSDRPIDGVDMSPILFENGKSNRELYYYYPKNPNPNTGVFAIRNNRYKVHFRTQGSHCGAPYRDEDCWDKTHMQVHDPPLLFDLLNDPSERYVLTNKTAEYAAVIEELTKAANDFESTVVWGASEMAKGSSKEAQPCCKPGCSPFPSCCQCNKIPYTPAVSPKIDN